MSAQFIFTMRRVSRFHPPDREVLRDITLAFYPGAKIGVIGPNGAGKSTLLAAIAGRLAPEEGSVRRRRGLRVGLLAQQAHQRRLSRTVAAQEDDAVALEEIELGHLEE